MSAEPRDRIYTISRDTTPSDRLVLAAISRLLPRSGWRSLIPRSETLLRWHRDLVRRKWAA